MKKTVDVQYLNMTKEHKEIERKAIQKFNEWWHEIMDEILIESLLAVAKD